MDKFDLIRFQHSIELDLLTGCWLWKTIHHENGYAYFTIKNKQMRAHRVSYEHWNGKIPKGLSIDHLCRNRNCVNPEHLEAVTHKENVRRSVPYRKGINQYTNRTHCKHGHEYNKYNTNYNENRRNCRICHRIRCREYRKNE